jgi:hypothetical protein
LSLARSSSASSSWWFLRCCCYCHCVITFFFSITLCSGYSLEEMKHFSIEGISFLKRKWTCRWLCSIMHEWYSMTDNMSSLSPYWSSTSVFLFRSLKEKERKNKFVIFLRHSRFLCTFLYNTLLIVVDTKRPRRFKYCYWSFLSFSLSLSLFHTRTYTRTSRVKANVIGRWSPSR